MLGHVSAHYVSMAASYSAGTATECDDVGGAMRKNAIVYMAYDSIRTRHPDEGVLNFDEADRVSRKAASNDHAASFLFSCVRTPRQAALWGPRPPPCFGAPDLPPRVDAFTARGGQLKMQGRTSHGHNLHSCRHIFVPSACVGW